MASTSEPQTKPWVALAKVASPPKRLPRKTFTMMNKWMMAKDTQVKPIRRLTIVTTKNHQYQTHKMPWAISKFRLTNWLLDAPPSTLFDGF